MQKNYWSLDVVVNVTYCILAQILLFWKEDKKHKRYCSHWYFPDAAYLNLTLGWHCSRLCTLMDLSWTNLRRCWQPWPAVFIFSWDDKSWTVLNRCRLIVNLSWGCISHYEESNKTLVESGRWWMDGSLKRLVLQFECFTHCRKLLTNIRQLILYLTTY